jgi:cell division topological specificity factor
MKFFRKIAKREDQSLNSKDAAKERLHLVLMQDRANVSADFLELMKQEIIEVIKKYIDVDETAIDVRLTNKDNGDGTKGAPALYANIPIVNIKDEARQDNDTNIQEAPHNTEEKTDEKQEEPKIDEAVEPKEENTEKNSGTTDEKEKTVVEESEEIIHEDQTEKVTIQNTEN